MFTQDFQRVFPTPARIKQLPDPFWPGKAALLFLTHKNRFCPVT